MKILHVSPSFYPAFYYGGPTYSTFRLCKAVADHGCDVRVLTTNANGPDALEVDTTIDVRLDSNFSVRYCRRVSPESVSLELLTVLPSYVRWADLVHLTAVYNFTTFPSLLGTRLAGKPLIWSLRGGLLRWTKSRRRTLKGAWELACRMLAPKHTVLHATSQQEADSSSIRFPRARTVVIPNGVDLPARVDRTKSSTFRLLYIGRLDPIKGIENLIEACALLATREPHLLWSLTIAGAGDADYTRRLADLVQQRHLGMRISFIGHVQGAQKTGLFGNSDVTIVPSHSENFGIVVAESLAHGVPVIASKGAPWSGLESRGCGFWVDNSPPTLASTLSRIKSMDTEEMGRRGRIWMEHEFAWDRIANRTIEVYKDALCGRAPTSSVAPHS